MTDNERCIQLLEELQDKDNEIKRLEGALKEAHAEPLERIVHKDIVLNTYECCCGKCSSCEHRNYQRTERAREARG